MHYRSSGRKPKPQVYNTRSRGLRSYVGTAPVAEDMVRGEPGSRQPMAGPSRYHWRLAAPGTERGILWLLQLDAAMLLGLFRDVALAECGSADKSPRVRVPCVRLTGLCVDSVRMRKFARPTLTIIFQIASRICGRPVTSRYGV